MIQTHKGRGYIPMGRDHRLLRFGLWARFLSLVEPYAGMTRKEGLSAEREGDEPALGLPPNLMHDTDSHSAAVAEVIDLNTRAAALSLSGELMRTDLTVNAGHTHNEEGRVELEWQNFGRWRPVGDVQGTGGPVESKGLIYVTATAPGDKFAMLAHVPSSNVKEVELWVRAAMPAPGAPTPDGFLFVNFDVYDLNAGSPFSAIKLSSSFSLQSIAGGTQHADKWLGPQLINLTSFTVTRGLYWVGVTLAPFVDVAGAIGGIWEAAIRRRSRGRF